MKADIYPPGSAIRILTITNKTRHGGERRQFNDSFQVVVPARVTGSTRIRQQYATREEAEAFAREQFQGTKVLGEQFFDVSPVERREAVAVLDLLRPRKLSIRDFVSEALAALDALPAGVTLLEAARFAGPRLRPTGGERTVYEVGEEMIASKTNRHASGDLRDRSLTDFKSRVRKFTDDHAETPVKDVSAAMIKSWVFGLKVSARSNQNYLNTLAEVFRYARQRKYILASPFEDFADDDMKEMKGRGGDGSEPNILTIDQASALLVNALAHPELDLLPAVTLGLFCGIRTAELMKLDWSHVRLSDKPEGESFVTIPASVAKKRRIRHVTIPANAVQWLSRCTRRTGPITRNQYSSDYRKRFLKLQQFAGFGKTDEAGEWSSTWEENGMRHSFGSYHFAAHANSMETSRQLGHRSSDHVLFDHYRALARKEDGEAFFNILPPEQTGVIVPMPATA